MQLEKLDAHKTTSTTTSADAVSCWQVISIKSGEATANCFSYSSYRLDKNTCLAALGPDQLVILGGDHSSSNSPADEEKKAEQVFGYTVDVVRETVLRQVRTDRSGKLSLGAFVGNQCAVVGMGKVVGLMED